jgi:hypothetical protein
MTFIAERNPEQMLVKGAGMSCWPVAMLGCGNLGILLDDKHFWMKCGA